MTIRLTEEHQRKLFKFIREKWGEKKPCPMCGEHRWTIDASVYRLAAMTTEANAAQLVM